MSARLAVVIHGLDQAEAVLRASVQDGRAVWLMSAPATPGGAGTRWFLALCAAAHAAVPGADAKPLLDCADRPGLALRALEDGAKAVVLDGDEADRGAVAEIAASKGAALIDRPGARIALAPQGRLPEASFLPAASA